MIVFGYQLDPYNSVTVPFQNRSHSTIQVKVRSMLHGQPFMKIEYT
jgi:hypothetical protein